MTASFAIKNGVAHNEDLDVKAPLFRIGGGGDIDIGNSRLELRDQSDGRRHQQGAGRRGASRSSPASPCRCG